MRHGVMVMSHCPSHGFKYDNHIIIFQKDHEQAFIYELFHFIDEDYINIV